MAVDQWRRKLGTELPAHQIRTKSSVTTALANVAAWQHARRQMYTKGKVCYDTALGFSIAGVQKKVECDSQARRHG